MLDTTSPEIVPHRRRSGSADYIFLVNDAREPGDYVGQYGTVHERGVPTTAEVILNSNAAAVYDLVSHQAVQIQRANGLQSLTIPVTLGPCDGWLLMAVPKPIAIVSITGPDHGQRGETWTGEIRVLDADGKPLDAVIPLSVEIFDGDGRLAEFSGYYAAVHGALKLSLDIAANDQPGAWEIRVQELASGQRQSSYFQVRRSPQK